MRTMAFSVLAILVAVACGKTEPDDSPEGSAGSSVAGSVGSEEAGRGGAGASQGGAVTGGATSLAGGGAGGRAQAGGGASSAGRDATAGADANAGRAGGVSSGGAGDAGSGGIAGTASDAGAGGDIAACAPGAIRCDARSRREVCSASSEWMPEPCPLETPTCDGGECVVRGPTMVKVNAYYVDSTEVTVAQYQAFLDAKQGDTSGQPAICSWNTNYDDQPLHNPDEFPMSNVDWCDARAYCEWADKHLCGTIGGGAIAFTETLTVTSQWFRACGGPNSWSHPNDDPDCNSGSSQLAPVKSHTGCEGFYPGLFDMEGNVAEWVDGCDGNTGADDLCALLGGGIYDMKSYCTEAYEDVKRSERAPSFGFRCCSG